MDNKTFSFYLNLIKFKNASIIKLKSAKSGVTKNCIVIPIEDNNVSTSEKGAFVPFISFPSDKVENQTHYIKQSFNKEFLDKLTEEERKSFPILGGVYKTRDVVPESSDTYTTVGSDAQSEPAPVDDLPF